AAESIVEHVDGGVGAHRERLAQRVGGTLWPHRERNYLAVFVVVFVLQRHLEGALVDLVDDRVRGLAVEQPCFGVEHTLTPRIGHLLHQCNDLHGTPVVRQLFLGYLPQDEAPAVTESSSPARSTSTVSP